MVLNCNRALPIGTIGRSLADQFSDQFCSSQGFDLIIGAIRHHFRSYLEAEPEVQAEVALYQTTRAPKGTFVGNTSRISNKLRKMESGFKELVPPTMKGFIIKRQAKLTHDQAKHLHFYIPTRGLEADKMVLCSEQTSPDGRACGTNSRRPSEVGAPCQPWSRAIKQPCAGVSERSRNFHVHRIEPQPQP